MFIKDINLTDPEKSSTHLILTSNDVGTDCGFCATVKVPMDRKIVAASMLNHFLFFLVASLLWFLVTYALVSDSVVFSILQIFTGFFVLSSLHYFSEFLRLRK